MPTVKELKEAIIALGGEPKGRKTALEAQLEALQAEQVEPEPVEVVEKKAPPRRPPVTPVEKARDGLNAASDLEAAVRVLVYKIESSGLENQVGSEWVSKVREYL